jgi:threonine synthase
LKFISTNKKAEPSTFLEAMRRGLAPDGGLYMPESIPHLSDDFWNRLHEMNFHDISFEIVRPYLSDELSDAEIQTVIQESLHFPVQMKTVQEGLDILELFHGPTLAFKDFGARFMARLFSEKAQKDQNEVTILVATSGDTGSAVAHGFYQIPGVQVCLLYPKGKVSRLQEQQMATLGENIRVLEVDGTFDDCQAMVKKAFVDQQLNRQMDLSSANSINIARLLPQSLYYVFAYGELQKRGVNDVVFSVPSGNFGNLTGGLLAMKMGMPVQTFLAATNVNDVVPQYLNGSGYRPRRSVQTIANAMDVGDPSNFVRIQSLFEQSDSMIRKHLKGYSFSDEETRTAIGELYEKTGYLACPHTAIGYLAAKKHQSNKEDERHTVVLSTAHPVKFRDVIEPLIHEQIEVPERLQKWMMREKKSVAIPNRYQEFKSFLLDSN